MENNKKISHRLIPLLCLLLGLSSLAGAATNNASAPAKKAGAATAATAPAAATTPVIAWEVKAEYPHRNAAFTQGFELVDGLVYESSGLYRASFITAWPLEKGDALFMQMLPGALFGEGLTVLKDKIYVLTWKERIGLIYDKQSREKIGEFSYNSEGWGLTNDGARLIMSDGTDKLRFLDPADGRVLKTVSVTENGQPVLRLNELERVGNRILANVWQTDTILVINPETGVVTGRIDLEKMYPKASRKPAADVLNGIAFDPADKTLLVTGKFWPTVFRLRLKQNLP